jgi:colicin import membrane protein
MCNVNLCEHGRTASIKKKYCGRKGPPYSASDCEEGDTEMGNDGNEYVVKADKNGTHRWVKVKSAEKPKKPKKSKKSSRKPKAKKPKEEADGDDAVVQKPKKSSKKKTIAQIRAECKKKGLVYDRETKRCRKSKRGKKKSPAKKSSRKPKAKKSKKSAKKSKKSSKKKTIAQIRAECKKKGLVYDRETKRCRKSRRGKKKSPAKKSSRKPKAKKSSKKKTIAQIRAECKKKGLVYDRETKRCRKSKRGKKSGKKSPKKSGKKSKKMYAKGDKAKCGKMPARLKNIRTPKVCVKVLTGPNKGKHRYVTLSAAQRGGYNPRK